MRRFVILSLLTILLLPGVAHSQKVGIKTNLLSDAFYNINLGLEVGLTQKWTLDMEGEMNNWDLSHGRKWKHWAVQPEARYWFCNSFGGHFLGIHGHGGKYNFGGFNGKYNFLGTNARKMKDYYYEGWFIGAGVAYGYAWMLGKHWNLEAEIGVGYSYTKYDAYECEDCHKRVKDDKGHNYVGPTRLAINIVYLF